MLFWASGAPGASFKVVAAEEGVRLRARDFIERSSYRRPIIRSTTPWLFALALVVGPARRRNGL